MAAMSETGAVGGKRSLLNSFLQWKNSWHEEGSEFEIRIVLPCFILKGWMTSRKEYGIVIL
ncbi:MAG: hypothetical protein GX383_09755 [Clostridium sp.]|jgi:hypothetical protein|nr:hypothetical protein [Clostridium sp.]